MLYSDIISMIEENRQLRLCFYACVYCAVGSCEQIVGVLQFYITVFTVYKYKSQLPSNHITQYQEAFLFDAIFLPFLYDRSTENICH